MSLSASFMRELQLQCLLGIPRTMMRRCYLGRGTCKKRRRKTHTHTHIQPLPSDLSMHLIWPAVLIIWLGLFIRFVATSTSRQASTQGTGLLVVGLRATLAAGLMAERGWLCAWRKNVPGTQGAPDVDLSKPLHQVTLYGCLLSSHFSMSSSWIYAKFSLKQARHTKATCLCQHHSCMNCSYSVS